MARSDIFLKLDGIDGESQDQAHKDEIEVESYTMGVVNAGAGGGSGPGKAMVNDMHFTMKVNKASPNVFIACCTGKPISTATVTVRKAGGESPLEYETVKLTGVFVSSVSKATHNDGEIGIENVSLTFAKIEYTYRPQTQTGIADAAITKSYDIKANKAS
jgi:type VI secretion system secreted protein Hcp